MSKKRLAIIIVTFNSEKYIEKCLNSIIKSKAEKATLKIIIIDNGSRDSTIVRVKSLTKKYSNIVLLQNEHNLGFAKAVNAGIKYSSNFEYYLLLNPDTVCNESSLYELLECARKNKAGITGGNTFDINGNKNGSYFRFPNMWVGIFDLTNFRKLNTTNYWHKYFYYLDKDFSQLSCFPVEVVTGGYMLIKKNTITKIGLLDERFFMYLEDVDYCLRARKKKIKVYHSNKSNIIHYSGMSSDNKDRIRHTSWLWSRKMYYLKNFNILTNLLLQPIFFLDDLFIMAKVILKQ